MIQYTCNTTIWKKWISIYRKRRNYWQISHSCQFRFFFINFSVRRFSHQMKHHLDWIWCGSRIGFGVVAGRLWWKYCCCCVWFFLVPFKFVLLFCYNFSVICHLFDVIYAWLGNSICICVWLCIFFISSLSMYESF